MKRLALLSILCACVCYSQTYYINVRLKGGGTTTIPIQDIQRISFSFSNHSVTGVDATKYATVIKTFNLLQNYPNPFNPSTTIRYEIPSPGDVHVTIFNVNGQVIKEFTGSSEQAGIHTMVWDGKNNAGQTVGSGVYIYKVTFQNSVLTRKMLFIK